jgi:cytoskeleton protein RodZ
MNDEIDKPEEDAPEAELQGPMGGERLAAARRERQISVLEIAKELHLDEPKVRALEKNDFEVLGAPVFAKGHLRKYSQLVGVNHEDVLADYYRLTRSQSMPPVVTRRDKPHREWSPGPWIAAVAVISVVAAAYWVISAQPFATPGADTPALPAATPATIPAGDEAPADEGGTEEPDPSPEELPPQTPEQEEIPQAESTPDPVPVAEGDVSLTMTFSGDCWTEISDASGRRLFFGLARAGEIAAVSGQEPLTVLFGDADNVSLSVNGSDFAIADADRRGRTARLMLYGN